jgi:hypothetical protein
MERRGLLAAQATVVKNDLTELDVMHPNTENEMTHAMQEFVKFSEHNTVGDHR